MLLLQIKGGNYQLAEKLLEAAAAKLVLNSRVTAVENTASAFYLHSEVCCLRRHSLDLFQNAGAGEGKWKVGNSNFDLEQLDENLVVLDSRILASFERVDSSLYCHQILHQALNWLFSFYLVSSRSQNASILPFPLNLPDLLQI